MSKVTYITSQAHLEDYAEKLKKTKLGEFGLHIEIKDGKRTLKQNSSIHVYCTQLAEELNDAGYDMKRVLKPEVDIPWTMELVKKWIWKPIQKIATEKESTTELLRSEVSEVYKIIARHMAQRFSISIPFPQNQHPD